MGTFKSHEKWYKVSSCNNIDEMTWNACGGALCLVFQNQMVFGSNKFLILTLGSEILAQNGDESS